MEKKVVVESKECRWRVVAGASRSDFQGLGGSGAPTSYRAEEADGSQKVAKLARKKAGPITCSP
jgi:hypothetical protein